MNNNGGNKGVTHYKAPLDLKNAQNNRKEGKGYLMLQFSFRLDRIERDIITLNLRPQEESCYE